MRDIEISVVFARPEAATEITLRSPQGTTLAEAINQSGLLATHPELEDKQLAYGIWGKHASPTRVLADGDRIEIYRPLVADPKKARIERALRRRKD